MRITIIAALAAASALALSVVYPASAIARSFSYSSPHYQQARPYLPREHRQAPSHETDGFRGYYRNSLGHLVPRPYGNWRKGPAFGGATALCGDGTNSFSEHPNASGTCSHHGGVEHFAGQGGAGQFVGEAPQPHSRDPREIPMRGSAIEIPIYGNPREIPIR
jgi:hypothetical protein